MRSLQWHYRYVGLASSKVRSEASGWVIQRSFPSTRLARTLQRMMNLDSNPPLLPDDEFADLIVLGLPADLCGQVYMLEIFEEEPFSYAIFARRVRNICDAPRPRGAGTQPQQPPPPLPLPTRRIGMPEYPERTTSGASTCTLTLWASVTSRPATSPKESQGCHQTTSNRVLRLRRPAPS